MQYNPTQMYCYLLVGLLNIGGLVWITKVLIYLLKSAWNVHVFVLGEEVHVPEAVDGDQGKVLLRLAQVVKRVSKFDTVGHEEVDVLC